MPPTPDHGSRTGLDLDLPGHVERELTSFLQRRRAEAELIDTSFADAVDALSGFVLGGGKRIRPTFAWWGWRGAGGDPDGPETPSVLRALSALELIQACALVHDDLMDDSAMRRGAPTIHVAFGERHRAEALRGEPERFGLAAAVLLGDLALAWADDMLFGAGLPPEALRRAAEPWRLMRTEVLAGQYLDVLTQARGDESVEAALRVPRMKTAAYTVERPLHLGAAIAGADEGLVEAFRRFGADIGIAFQLRDDLLGVFGDPEVTGKPAGDDLREGKRTLLVALGLEHAETSGRHDAAGVLRAAVGDPELTEERVEVVRELLVDLGAVAAVERRIDELREAALAALAAAPVAEPAATRLAELAVAATRRAW
ncbi:geranylgeranyl diphosphate synthase, type I [Streptoalloteichus tenebrarius]|uniref:Geranylgeranyl diphosphate synthase, type I n=1 Tax=Streptoalloteichus tenebrarius (strain ATCC 17920 / DSM 40477 / JCM 4838 / CBS 697.72 / NBRC 16177 / NCIMB 11028 / NRRL B-12390 / A12253. 1 / ISP 5477) TaxID=1933 RepID=A0ABT1HML6_STRSD|nr:polyprenyl synthetase family protein [Streptoalloteichus tenebrarius]MCP2256738.1 geranylgeranyl diphosphate synthase, type I [Streptoalloteichus tenebrarius]BFF00360.1 polyprenyl synthetase family protein [Streptoalloteichus tenebrarius]